MGTDFLSTHAEVNELWKEYIFSREGTHMHVMYSLGFHCFEIYIIITDHEASESTRNSTGTCIHNNYV